MSAKRSIDTRLPLILTDPLPFGIIPTGANATQGSCETAGRLVTCHLGALLPGGSATISITGISGFAGLFTNVVTVTSVVGDPNLTNNTVTNVSTATAPADNDNDGMPNWWETLYGLNAFSNFGDHGANGRFRQGQRPDGQDGPIEAPPHPGEGEQPQPAERRREVIGPGEQPYDPTEDPVDA